jgi:hypothetical protein
VPNVNAEPAMGAVKLSWERFSSRSNDEATKVMNGASRVISFLFVAELNLKLQTVERSAGAVESPQKELQRSWQR